MVIEDGLLTSVTGFTVAQGKIFAIDVLADLDRLGALDISLLDS